jgi:hypothetical protein
LEKHDGQRKHAETRDSVITLKVYARFVEDKKNDVQELASIILS